MNVRFRLGFLRERGVSSETQSHIHNERRPSSTADSRIRTTSAEIGSVRLNQLIKINKIR